MKRCGIMRKAFDAQLEDLSLSPQTLMVEGERDENNSQNLSPGRHMHAGAGDTVTNSHKHTR